MPNTQNTHSANTGRVQLGPRVTPATKALLDQACAERHASVSDLVDDALQRYLGVEAADPHALMEKLLVIEEILKVILEYLTKQTDEEKPKVATYDQMYGAIEAPTMDVPDPTLHLPPRPSSAWRRIATNGQMDGAVVPDPAPAVALPRLPAPRGWKRWFFREESA